jgi:hypothetical protein
MMLVSGCKKEKQKKNTNIERTKAMPGGLQGLTGQTYYYELSKKKEKKSVCGQEMDV